MSAYGFDAVAGGDVPDSEGLVARGGDQEVAGGWRACCTGWDESDGGNGVVVTG